MRIIRIDTLTASPLLISHTLRVAIDIIVKPLKLVIIVLMHSVSAANGIGSMI